MMAARPVITSSHHHLHHSITSPSFVSFDEEFR